MARETDTVVLPPHAIEPERVAGIEPAVFSLEARRLAIRLHRHCRGLPVGGPFSDEAGGP